MHESVIVDRLEQHFSSQGPLTMREVPFVFRHVDLVVYDERLNKVTAIEAKIENWRKAVSQALRCLLFADEVFIALPEEYVHRVNLGELRVMGIGLLSVGEAVIEVLPPGLANLKREPHWQWVTSLLSKTANARGRGNEDSGPR